MRTLPVGPEAQAVERYLHTHLTSMSFFGPSFYGRPYLEGLGSLLLTYPMICWFARVFALSEGWFDIDPTTVEKALMVVDHQHGVTPALAIATERQRARFFLRSAGLEVTRDMVRELTFGSNRS